MSAPQRILVPVDLSKRSRRTFACALALAKPWEARLTLLHVAPTSADAATRDGLLQQLVSLVEPAERNLPIHVEIVQGEAAPEILATARSCDADLIVLGAGHWNPVSHALFESVSDAVVLGAPCSVLITGDEETSAVAVPRISRVLCAVDLTDSSPATLAAAAMLASGSHAWLFVRHVVEPWNLPAHVPLSTPEIEEARAVLDRSASHRLAALLSPYSGRGLDIDAEVLFGAAGPGLVEASSTLGANMLVLGGHARKVWGHTFLGPTSRYARRHAACPVLFARPRRSASDSEGEAIAASVVAKA